MKRLLFILAFATILFSCNDAPGYRKGKEKEDISTEKKDTVVNKSAVKK